MNDRFSCENRHFRRPTLEPKEYKRVIYDPGLVTRIILNRPRYMNACSHALLAELEDAFDRASEDEKCHVIVLSGAGRNFCSGDDVIGLTPESAPTLWDGDARPPEELIKQYGSESAVWHQYNIEHDYMIMWQHFHKFRTVPKPTIAMVQGYCAFMGFILPMSMDIIFASEDALFLYDGFMPEMIWDLGRRKAMERAYEHRFMTAREACECGMVNRIFPNYEILEKEAMAFAYRIADESPRRLQLIKEEYLNTMDIYGLTTAFEMMRYPFRLRWRQWAEEGHRMRYEGKGIARTPVALANLKAKLESEGKEVPENVRAALVRAVERDDRATWQRSLHQEWRASDRVARAEASVKAYNEMRAESEREKKEELERRGLSDIFEKVKLASERIKKE